MDFFNNWMRWEYVSLSFSSAIMALALIFAIYKIIYGLLKLKSVPINSLIYNIFTSTLSTLVAASIIYCFAVWGYANKVTGKFDVYILTEDVKNIDTLPCSKDEHSKPFGEVRLLNEIFSDRYKIEFKAEPDHDLLLEGTAKLQDRGSYLAVEYTQTDQLVTRHGVVLLKLMGDGKSYCGKYVFRDPTHDNQLFSGKALWVRKK